MRSPTETTNSGCIRLIWSIAFEKILARWPPVRSLTMANWKSAGSLFRRRWVTGLSFSLLNSSSGRAALGPDQATATASTTAAAIPSSMRFMQTSWEG